MKKIKILFTALILVAVTLTGCSAGSVKPVKNVDYYYKQNLNIIDDNYRNFYEVFLSSYYDSNGDGNGDINGLIKKLDYLNDGKGGGLGITGIWLMPIMPSPSYHKYDVTDYMSIDPSLGTMSDFEKLVKECHKRGIKLIMDYVINHTSSQHPWFQSAVKTIEQNPKHPANNKYIKYYNFTRDPGKFKSTEVGNTGWYYESEFVSTMPDLNLDNSDLRRDITKSLKFWLGKGVDGFRLDAVLHYYEGNDNKNIAFVNWLTDTCQTVNKNVYVVGEVTGDTKLISSYYASKDASYFAFPFATETGILAETLNSQESGSNAKTYAENVQVWQKMLMAENKNAIDAPFISNHDQDRAAGYFQNDILKTKMAGGLYLTMSGSTFTYYGEEIGMIGSGRDENKREPMNWSSKNKNGITSGPEFMENIEQVYPAEDVQINDKNSILNYYRRAFELRNENPEIARGTVKVLSGITDGTMCAIKKTYKSSSIILVYNISETAKTLNFSRSKYNYRGIRGYLSATGEAAELSGDTLNLPPMSIVVLK